MGIPVKEPRAALPKGWLSLGGHYFRADTVTTVKPHGTDPTKSFVIHGIEKASEQWAGCDCTASEAWEIVRAALSACPESPSFALTKRELFALELAKGILASPSTRVHAMNYRREETIVLAMRHADALLAALAEQEAGDE